MIQELYEKYLSQTYVRLEMVKCIQTHELSLINRKEKIYIRYLIGNSLKILDYKIARFNIMKRPRNFYISCAFHSRLPIISDDLRTRKETPEYQNFNNNYIDSCIGFDLLFDLDGKHGEDYYNEAIIIKNLLEEYKVPFFILSSSFSGLHIVVPYQYLPKKPIKEIVDDIGNKIIPNIISIYDLNSVDIEIMDLKKLRKVAYSPVIDGSCCIPMNNKILNQLKDDKSIISIENVLKNIEIKNRGLLIRTYGETEESLKKNVLRFWKDFLE